MSKLHNYRYIIIDTIKDICLLFFSVITWITLENSLLLFIWITPLLLWPILCLLWIYLNNSISHINAGMILSKYKYRITYKQFFHCIIELWIYRNTISDHTHLTHLHIICACSYECSEFSNITPCIISLTYIRCCLCLYYISCVQLPCTFLLHHEIFFSSQDIFSL